MNNDRYRDSTIHGALWAAYRARDTAEFERLVSDERVIWTRQAKTFIDPVYEDVPDVFVALDGMIVAVGHYDYLHNFVCREFVPEFQARARQERRRAANRKKVALRA